MGASCLAPSLVPLMETICASTVLLFTLVNAGMISASTMIAAPTARGQLNNERD